MLAEINRTRVTRAGWLSAPRPPHRHHHPRPILGM